MKKRHLSLSIQILILCLTLVLLISIIFSLLFVSNANRITKKNFLATAEITMKYLESDIQNALSKSFDMTNSTDSFASRIESTDLMKDILSDTLKTNPDAFEFYYGTVISCYEPGGYFVAVADIFLDVLSNIVTSKKISTMDKPLLLILPDYI